MLPFLRRIRTFAKNRLGKIGRLELRFLKIAPFWLRQFAPASSFLPQSFDLNKS
jgi:hypothetical protein